MGKQPPAALRPPALCSLTAVTATESRSVMTGTEPWHPHPTRVTFLVLLSRSSYTRCKNRRKPGQGCLGLGSFACLKTKPPRKVGGSLGLCSLELRLETKHCLSLGGKVSKQNLKEKFQVQMTWYANPFPQPKSQGEQRGLQGVLNMWET